jgi:Flp pilus assembly protein TadD
MVGLSALLLCASCATKPPPPPVAPEHPITGDVARNAAIAHANTEKGFKFLQQGKYAEAEAVLKQAIDADAMYGPSRNDLGVVYYRTNRLYDAAWQFQNAIKLMPGQPAPLNNLGLVLEQAGKLNEAMKQYAAARDLSPDDPEYLGNLARARIRIGLRDDQTRKLLEEILLKDSRPDWVDWARTNLLRLHGTIEQSPTRPTNHVSP